MTMIEETFPGLPEKCFICLLSTNEVVIVERGKKGYSGTRPGNMPWQGQELADLLNERDGVTKGQAEAMIMGSMFGWRIPSANPASYDDNGVML
jgi:hypothetical protein